MRKFDCNSFRITDNTNFKKKLTSFVSKICLEKSSYEQPALKLSFFDRSLNDCYESTLRNKRIQTDVIFWKIYLKIQMFLYSNEIRLF